MIRRKIAIVTGSRAEYGLLYWLMQEIQTDSQLELQIIATGAHLSPEFGLTYRQIEVDGFKINAKVEMLMSSDSPIGIAKSIGLGVIGFADALSVLTPDMLVVLGDRFEIFAAAQAAVIARIPIAHLCGGESCETLIDEPIRHALTKMSQLHFVTAEPYRQRVIQMGESPERVFNFGTSGLDHLTRSALLDKETLENEIDFKFDSLTFLITYHNVTLKSESPERALKEIFKALGSFPQAKIIFTRPNSDTGGRIINELIDSYAATNSSRVKVYANLGTINYLSVMKYADVIIGNSSSGLVETPFFKKPTINIGDRQKGRLKATSVINCNADALQVSDGIMMALSSEFQAQLLNTRSPYGMGNVSNRIKNVIKDISLDNIVLKTFYDFNTVSEWPRC